MIARLQALALTALAVVLVLSGAYVAAGRSARRAAQLQHEADDARRSAAAAKETNDVEIQVGQLPAGGAADELRNEWMRQR